MLRIKRKSQLEREGLRNPPPLGGGQQANIKNNFLYREESPDLKSGVLPRGRVYAFFMLTLAFCFLYSTPLKAALYQCEDPQGNLEFRDVPCHLSTDRENLLPIVYEKTNPKTVKTQARILKKEIKAREKKARATERAETRRLKAAEKQKAQALRKIERCRRLDEKINFLESLLKQGCKAKRWESLKKQIQHCEQMKLRYCRG